MFVEGGESLLVVRALRFLRIFRLFKLAPYLVESETLLDALYRSRRKIAVFLASVLTLVMIVGSLMYVVEGPENGFTSIPASIYWTIVTITTVGFGDITPRTELGRLIASAVMLVGFAIIAIPTGIVSAELAEAKRHPLSSRACEGCGDARHELDADFCKHCGAHLPPLVDHAG